jgi:hypothetical protein
MPNLLIGLPGRIFYEQSPLGCKESDEHALIFAVSPFSVSLNRLCHVITHVWRMLSSQNACLIIARVSVEFGDLHKMLCCSFVGLIAKSHEPRYTTPNERL